MFITSWIDLVREVKKLRNRVNALFGSAKLVSIGNTNTVDATKPNTIQYNTNGSIYVVDGTGTKVGSGGAPYKTYVAQIRQSSTSDPVATVLENTLGGTVVWTRQSGGKYYGTLAGAFTKAKTVVLMTRGFVVGGFYHAFPDDASSGNFIELQTYTSGYSQADNIIQPSFSTIEIRVYP